MYYVYFNNWIYYSPSYVFFQTFRKQYKKKRLVVKIKKDGVWICNVEWRQQLAGGGGNCEVFGKNVQYIDIGVCEYRPS